MAMLRHIVNIFACALLSSAALGAVPITWQDYRNERFGYEVDLPLGMFTGSRDGEAGVTLRDSEGEGEIRVYGGVNEGSLSPEELEDVLASAGLVREVTYARRGSSWFVISGYATEAAENGEDLIYYTKVMFSADRQALSAFEARYPISDKRLYDAVIERMEDSLTAPR
jgi:hypothetical protein